jgi:type VI secretion system protein ImpE
MTGDELFQAGKLREAIEAQSAIVRKNPSDQDARYTLFVLLSFEGELERAEKALDVIAELDPEIAPRSVIYRNLLLAEYERRKVFEASAVPTLPPDAPGYAKSRLEALRWMREGDLDSAEKHIDQAVEQTPELEGKLNGEPFEAFRDYDDLLASIFEVYAGGRYIWMPVTSVRKLELVPPTTALDLLWRQAKLHDAAGDVADVHLPVLYPPSYAHENEAVKLGRLTDWAERGPLYTGIGQHVFLAVRGGERYEESILGFETFEVESVG